MKHEELSSSTNKPLASKTVQIKWYPNECLTYFRSGIQTGNRSTHPYCIVWLHTCVFCFIVPPFFYSQAIEVDVPSVWSLYISNSQGPIVLICRHLRLGSMKRGPWSPVLPSGNGCLTGYRYRGYQCIHRSNGSFQSHPPCWVYFIVMWTCLTWLMVKYHVWPILRVLWYLDEADEVVDISHRTSGTVAFNLSIVNFS